MFILMLHDKTTCMQICDSLVYFLVFDTCRKTKTITTTKVQVDVKVHVYTQDTVC